MHDPRIGRFFAVDPLEKYYPYNSPFAFSENRAIDLVELEGLETGFRMPHDGSITVEDLVNNEDLQAMSQAVVDWAGDLTSPGWWNDQIKSGIARQWNAHGLGGFTDQQKEIEKVVVEGAQIAEIIENGSTYDRSYLFLHTVGTATLTKKLSSFVKIKSSNFSINDPFVHTNSIGPSKWIVYSLVKKGKLYVGKAKNRLTNRYTKKFIDESGAEALIRDIPDNDTALGVERLVLDKYGGGAKSPKNSNVNHPTNDKARIKKGKEFLDKNYKGWDEHDDLGSFRKAIDSNIKSGDGG
jgi:hypothetical protein